MATNFRDRNLQNGFSRQSPERSQTNRVGNYTEMEMDNNVNRSLQTRSHSFSGVNHFGLNQNGYNQPGFNSSPNRSNNHSPELSLGSWENSQNSQSSQDSSEGSQSSQGSQGSQSSQDSWGSTQSIQGGFDLTPNEEELEAVGMSLFDSSNQQGNNSPRITRQELFISPTQPMQDMFQNNGNTSTNPFKPAIFSPHQSGQSRFEQLQEKKQTFDSAPKGQESQNWFDSSSKGQNTQEWPVKPNTQTTQNWSTKGHDLSGKNFNFSDPFGKMQDFSEFDPSQIEFLKKMARDFVSEKERYYDVITSQELVIKEAILKGKREKYNQSQQAMLNAGFDHNSIKQTLFVFESNGKIEQDALKRLNQTQRNAFFDFQRAYVDFKTAQENYDNVVKKLEMCEKDLQMAIISEGQIKEKLNAALAKSIASNKSKASIIFSLEGNLQNSNKQFSFGQNATHGASQGYPTNITQQHPTLAHHVNFSQQQPILSQHTNNNNHQYQEMDTGKKNSKVGFR